MARFFVLALIPIFLLSSPSASERLPIEIITRADQLPAPVQRMHKAITRAARSGKIDQLREVLQLSELMPLINGKFVHDPVKSWKAASKDKNGRDILAILTEILELPAAKKVTKSGELYIWPYFAQIPLDRLSPSEAVRLYRLGSAAKIAAMIKNNHYAHAFLIIGSDGTWHSFEYPVVP